MRAQPIGVHRAGGLAQIGLDRLFGTGVKHNDRFTHTHLGDPPDAG